jgi:predicted neuraminidase
MKCKLLYGLILLVCTAGNTHVGAQKWKKGILVDEFIYTEAPFPQAHASAIAETPDGLIAAWFGGTREGNTELLKELLMIRCAMPVTIPFCFMHRMESCYCFIRSGQMWRAGLAG